MILAGVFRCPSPFSFLTDSSSLGRSGSRCIFFVNLCLPVFSILSPQSNRWHHMYTFSVLPLYHFESMPSPATSTWGGGVNTGNVPWFVCACVSTYTVVMVRALGDFFQHILQRHNSLWRQTGHRKRFTACGFVHLFLKSTVSHVQAGKAQVIRRWILASLKQIEPAALSNEIGL